MSQGGREGLSQGGREGLSQGGREGWRANQSARVSSRSCPVLLFDPLQQLYSNALLIHVIARVLTAVASQCCTVRPALAPLDLCKSKAKLALATLLSLCANAWFALTFVDCPAAPLLSAWQVPVPAGSHAVPACGACGLQEPVLRHGRAGGGQVVAAGGVANLKTLGI